MAVFHIILRHLALIDLPLFCEEIDREALPFHFTTDIFSAKSRLCICKHFVNKLPPPAVRRRNSFCLYGIAVAMGLRHTNGNIGVTISKIRPECFSFSLPLLQSQKRFLATSANKAFVINRPVRFSPLLRSGVGELAKPDTKKWTRLSPCPICTSNLLIFIQS